MGKFFDIVLLILIVVSIVVVMLESVHDIGLKYYNTFHIIEWVITIFFTIEYIARIIAIRKPGKYIFSFYGVIDFLSTIPLYLSLILVGSNFLLTLRAFRLLRVFRILKITRFVGEGNQLGKALMQSRAKIMIFVFVVLIVAVIAGTLMYLIEGEESGFTSIPVGVYWCIVTLTTVGFGDIAPVTAAGQFLASAIMVLGYGVIAVPASIVSANYAMRSSKDFVPINTQACRNCGETKHQDEAKFCYNCGYELHPERLSEK